MALILPPVSVSPRPSSFHSPAAVKVSRTTFNPTAGVPRVVSSTCVEIPFFIRRTPSSGCGLWRMRNGDFHADLVPCSEVFEIKLAVRNGDAAPVVVEGAGRIERKIFRKGESVPLVGDQHTQELIGPFDVHLDKSL